LVLNSIEQKLLEIRKDRRVLVETESKEILEQWGIPIVPCEVATSRQEALGLAHSIGFPVVLKTLSPDIIHKTEAGGVKPNLNTDEDVRSGFDEIIKSSKRNFPSAKILGVTVQKMVSGIEVVIYGRCVGRIAKGHHV
jgi:acyl-CoA synthetase (NDP forming)